MGTLASLRSFVGSDAFGRPRRAELLHVLMLPDFERAAAIGKLWGTERRLGELLVHSGKLSYRVRRDSHPVATLSTVLHCRVW